MSYEVELSDRSSVEKNFSLKIEADFFNSKFQKELSKVTSKAHLKGFRPGRAPRAMVAKMYGGRIHTDIVSDFVNEALRKTVDENNLSLVGTSDFVMHDVKDGEPVSVSMVLSLYPEPKLEKVEGLEVEVEVQNFTEKDLEDRLASVADMFGEVVDVEDRTTVQENDFIVITYAGEADGKTSDDLKGESVQIELGKNQLPEDIEKALTGMSVGETREVLHQLAVNQPEPSEDEGGASKEVLFRITLEKIKKKVLPEYNDEFAKKTGVAETFAELRVFIEKDLKRNFSQKNRDARDNAIVDAVVRENDFEIPQTLLDREIRYMLAEMRLLDPSSEDFHQTPVEHYRELLKEQAGGRVKRGVVVEQLIKDYSITSSKEDVENMLDQLSEEAGVDRSELNREYGYPSQIDNLMRLCSVRRLTNMLSEKVKITEKEISGEEEN
jgi:trigger factor